VPSSIKLKAELGDDFNVIFVESQGTSAEGTEAFIYRQRWGASQGMWTSEPPCESGSSTLPSFVLLGNNGQVLITGYPAESKLKDLINAEIKAAKSAPKDTPAPLVKAYADFNKGLYANAILAATKLAETPAAEDKNGMAALAKERADQWTKQAKARVERLDYLMSKAQFAKADAEVLALKPALKGLPDLEAKLAEASTKLAAEDLKVSREAAKALDNLMAKVNDKGVDDKTTKDLKKLADKYPGTPPGDRAAHLAKILEKKPAAD